MPSSMSLVVKVILTTTGGLLGLRWGLYHYDLFTGIMGLIMTHGQNHGHNNAIERC